MEKLINVYKASAGSGKTYTLTKEYIELILRDKEAYKHILAVTFTNKATDEMKQRIIEELYNLAKSGSDESERAREVLISILHDYSAFSVSTIDKFFQGVMRSFARELGHISSYNIELDTNVVREQAVDMLFADLDSNENSELLDWLIKYSLENIDEGNAWRVKQPIGELAKSLFMEDFKLKRDRNLSAHQQREQVNGLKARIAGIIGGFEQRCKEISGKALELISGAGLACENFAGAGNSPFRIFEKLAKGDALGAPLKSTFLDKYNNLEKWYTKSCKNTLPFESLYAGGLNDCIGELIEHFRQNQPLYLTALSVKSNLNTLGILGCVYANIITYCRENNVMLLSETTELLGEIIDESDTPFIYEKVGCWINNFMLDEFQDTSAMQWRNFLPLLKNSISMGEKNLIVGDVKQSIYRWRNSDWTILNSNVDATFGETVGHKALSTNWRSMENIINFNNAFFELAAETVSDVYRLKFANASNESAIEHNAALITDIYSNFEQEIPEGKQSAKENLKGYVEADFIDDSQLGDNDLTYEDVMGKLLVDTMQRLVSQGYDQKDIGVLVRRNWQAANVAKILLDAGYRVVSADSLTISSSPVVEKIVNIMREIDSPYANALKAYSIIKGTYALGSLDEEKREGFVKMPLYQMCEEIVRVCLTEKQKQDVVFIQAFLDIVLDFTTRNGSTLGAFLRWWDETGIGKTISFPDGQDAVQVMTVHKSKGLAFDVVILPYFEESLTSSSKHSTLLWSNSASGELGYDGPLPVKSVQALNNTLFEKDYQTEILNESIDALNLAYVAFTRPRNELVLIARKAKYSQTKKAYSKSSISDILFDCCSALGGNQLSGFVKADREIVFSDDAKVQVDGFTIGKPMDAQDNARLKKKNVTGKIKTYMLEPQLQGELDMGRIKTAMQSGSIAEDGLSLRDNGIIMHDVFASINSVEDARQIEDAQIREQVLEMLSFVEERGWFSDKYTVFKECSIIEPSGMISRPDRVLVANGEAIVIDYKFGDYKANNKKYHKQLKNYMQLLMDMGFTAVSGYLWYTKDSVIETVAL